MYYANQLSDFIFFGFSVNQLMVYQLYQVLVYFAPQGLVPKGHTSVSSSKWFHYFGLIHLISLNKYVVHKIINQGLSCLTYFMIVSKLITLCSNRSQGIIPLAISILCYANKDLCGVNKMQFVQVSSIFRCYIRFVSKQGYSLKVLFD